MNIHYVYEYYNIDTNEVFYVGKGKNDRYRLCNSRNKYFNHYYNKYNCDVRFVKNNLTNKEACKIEKELIAHYRKLGQAKCNITDGGDGGSAKGEKHPMSRKVIQLDLEGNFIKEWNYIKEAAKELNINHSDIGACCKRKIKSSGGFMWLYKEEFNSLFINPYKNNWGEHNKRNVVQLTLDGVFIKEWSCISEAQRELNVGHISSCCNGDRKSAGGFLWVYSDDYDQNKNYTYNPKSKNQVTIKFKNIESYI